MCPGRMGIRQMQIMLAPTMVQTTLFTDSTVTIRTVTMCGTTRKAHHQLRYAVTYMCIHKAPLVDITFLEELGRTIHLSNEPEYRLPHSRKCPTHACRSWPIPCRVQHTTGPRTFSLHVCYSHILRTVCLTISVPQDIPNDGVRDRSPPMPDVADAFSRSVPESAPSTGRMSAMEGLKRLADCYLHDPGSQVDTLRMGPSPSDGQLRVVIILDIDV